MKLPVVSGKELIRILRQKGYFVKDQKGSHIHLWHGYLPPITIPNHKTIAFGTLLEIMKAADLRREDFL